MFSFNGGFANAMAQFTNLSFLITVIAIILSAPIFPFIKGKLESTAGGAKAAFICEGVMMVVLVLTSVLFLTGSDYNPFIYFRF